MLIDPTERRRSNENTEGPRHHLNYISISSNEPRFQIRSNSNSNSRDPINFMNLIQMMINGSGRGHVNENPGLS